MTEKTISPLYEEHLRLGVTFDGKGIPLHYGSPAASRDDAGVMLADLSHLPMLCCHGTAADTFVHTAFAGRRLAVGECGFQAVLTGDGGLASVPLLARTGTAEYILTDASPRSEVLHGWLSFLSAIEQDGVTPFEGMQIDDVAESHVVLGLWGPKATELLADYTEIRNLPSPEQVVACNLDAIPCILLNLALPHTQAYLVLVPPQFGVVLWRSMLSFTYVVPAGSAQLSALLASELPWTAWLDTADTVRIGAKALSSAGLIRQGGDFVGARGLDRQGRQE